MKGKLLIFASALAFVFASCDKVPQAEIDAAFAAVDSSKAVQADLYLPAEFGAVKDSLNSAMAKVEAQKAKWFKKFEEPKNQLIAVKAAADQLITNTAARKEALKAEITATLAEVKTLVEENKALVAKAPKGKEGKAAIEAINNEMGVIEASVTEAEGMFNGGELLATIDKVKAAKEKATAIKTELEEVIAKKAGKK